MPRFHRKGKRPEGKGSGEHLEELGRKQDAIADYRKALQLMPKDGFTMERLVVLGEMVDVYTDLNDPRSKVFLWREDYCNSVRNKWEKHPGNAGFLLGQARVILEDKKPDLALEAAERAIDIDAGSADAWLYKGVALRLLGRMDEAEAALNQHLRLAPDSAWGYVNLGTVISGSAGLGAAKPCLEKALALDSNALDALRMLVIVEDAAGSVDFAASIAKAEEMICRYPQSWAAWRLLGELRQGSGDASSAIEAYGKAAGMGADDETLAQYSGELGKAGRASEICVLADTLGDLAGRSTILRWNVAHAYAAVGRKHDARRVFEQMIGDTLRIEPGVRERCKEILRSLR